MGAAGRHEYRFAGGNDQNSARSAHRSMAQDRAEAAIEKSLTQAHSFANAIHDLIGNFIGALRAPGEDIVDV